MEEAAKTNSAVKDLRTVGVMFPKKVEVQTDDQKENNDGRMLCNHHIYGQ